MLTCVRRQKRHVISHAASVDARVARVRRKSEECNARTLVGAPSLTCKPWQDDKCGDRLSAERTNLMGEQRNSGNRHQTRQLEHAILICARLSNGIAVHKILKAYTINALTLQHPQL